jgi:hypothetical protein
MRNLLLSGFVATLFATSAFAQVSIFSEDFQGGVIPGTFTLIDNDGRTPDPNVSYVNAAWIARPDFSDPTDTVAASTSWYSPVGMADDWLITPAIVLDTGNILSWEAKSNGTGLYLDGYEVKISTSGTTIPDFTITVFSVAEENNTWTSRTVDLGAYGLDGDTVHIAFRNNSNDKFLLFIDDINVYKSYNDLSVSRATPNEVTIMPQNQISSFDLSARVKSIGGASSNVKLVVDVSKDSAPILSDTSATIASLASGQDTLLVAHSGFTPSGPGNYVMTYTAILDETDTDPLNNSSIILFEVSDTIYARDNGMFGGAVGFNGAAGSLGQIFEIFNQDTLSSITVLTTGIHTGDNFSFTVYPAINDTTMATQIYTSPVYTFDGSEDSVWKTYMVNAIAAIAMAPANYLVVIDQLASNNILLAYDDDGGDIIGTPQWNIYSTFGSPFLRINLGTPPPPDTTTGILTFDPAGIQLNPNPANDLVVLETGDLTGAFTIEVSNLLGQTGLMLAEEQATGNLAIDVSSLDAGVWFVKVIQGESMVTRRLVISR